jgi:hypothetical protein
MLLHPFCSGKALSITYSEHVCNLRYPVCYAHAPYCHLWPALHYNIFPCYLKNVTIVKKKVIQHKMCVLISSTNSVLNISHSRNNWERYDQICLVVFMYSTWFSCPVLMKLEFSWQFLKKYSNIKFHENLSSGSRVVSSGQTWRNLIVAIPNFCERA